MGYLFNGELRILVCKKKLSCWGIDYNSPKNYRSMISRKQKQAYYRETSGITGRILGKLCFGTQLGRREGHRDIIKRWKDMVR